MSRRSLESASILDGSSPRPLPELRVRRRARWFRAEIQNTSLLRESKRYNHAVDKITSQQRSENMRKIRSSNTKPELHVRSILWKANYRFRLHATNLPGRPDVVFRGRKKVILIHGCFWHQHPRCKEASTPKSNQFYWEQKLRLNVHRDRKTLTAFEELGWRVLVIWECEVFDAKLERRLRAFLGPPSSAD
jgi:DNA mismatch endonuclease (patch repair protein)